MSNAHPPISRRAFAGGALVALAACARSGSVLTAPRAETRPPTLPAPSPESVRPAPPLARADADAQLGAALPALTRRYPALGAALPFVSLGVAPTAIEGAPRLARAAGLEALYVKRDDVSAPAYGGGKPRKLELLLGEALRSGSRTVVTSGGAGSNHAVATAIYGASLGLHVVLELAPQPPSDEVRRNLTVALRHGATIVLGPSARLAALERAPRPHHVIPAGGTSPLGNVGFVEAGLELAEQLARGDAPEPDVVYLAMGTMGSAAGLAIGLAAAGLAIRVVAVRASSPGTSSEPRLRALFDATVRSLRALDPSFPDVPYDASRLAIDGAHLGGGYSRPTREGARALELAREHAGLGLESTYTAKALAALLAKGVGARVALFWNTHNGRLLDASPLDAGDVPAAVRGYL